MKNSIQSIVFIGALLALPVAAWTEKQDHNLWNSRLAIPNIVETQNRHTPVHALGTHLPPLITENRTITAKENPVIISQTTTIPENVTLTVAEGTRIYANEYSNLTIHGRLDMQGVKDAPITVTSNETHPQNRVWGGFIFTHTGTGSISHTNITYASPGISCLEQSNVKAEHIDVTATNNGIFAKTDTCTINSSRIASTKHGITTITASPNIIESDITALEKPINNVTLK